MGRDRRLARQWVDMPRRLYAGDANWVAPLRSEALKAMNPRRDPIHRHAEIEHWLLPGESGPVGRIAGTVYPAYNERFDTSTAFFGWFECEPDPEAAGALLGAVERWAAERGIDRVAGPYNYFSGQEMGLLIDGFDTPPALFSPHNPPGYRALLEANGYELAFSVATYRIDMAEIAGRIDPAIDAGRRVMDHLGLTTRHLDRRRFGDEVELLRRLFNASFADNHEVLPYERDVFHSMVRPLKRLIDERLVSVVERDGEPIAFSIVVPNLNEVLSRLDGRIRLRDLVRLRGMLRDVRGAVILLIGALPEVPMGVGQVLVAEIVRALRDARYEFVHTTWIHQENAAVQALARYWRAEPDKRYGVFEREVSGA
ncbi:MAG TPA: hypothetical protein VF712_06845 [Thermoleophilaceae bacterium]